MSKYIDAEKLIAEIKRFSAIEEIIPSLQQEQPELSNEFEIAINRRLNLINGENLTATELLEETKGMAAELLNLARKVIEQEQPEVDLEKEYKEYVEDDPVFSKLTNRNAGLVIARHFYEFGLNARKEE